MAHNGGNSGNGDCISAVAGPSEAATPSTVTSNIPCDKRAEGWTFTLRDPSNWAQLKNPNFYKKVILPYAISKEVKKDESETAIVIKELATKVDNLVGIIQHSQVAQSNCNTLFIQRPQNRKPEESTVLQNRSRSQPEQDLSIHQRNDLRCSICLRHCKTILASTRFICESCFKRFGTNQAYQTHIRQTKECRRVLGIPNQGSCIQRTGLIQANLTGENSDLVQNESSTDANADAVV